MQQVSGRSPENDAAAVDVAKIASTMAQGSADPDQAAEHIYSIGLLLREGGVPQKYLQQEMETFIDLLRKEQAAGRRPTMGIPDMVKRYLEMRFSGPQQ